jgi:hypothetical protein
MALALIDELGANLERDWAGAGFDVAAFPRVCVERLRTARLETKLDPDEIVKVVFRGELPLQVDPGGKFGQPPVTLFRTERFFIDALFWADGTTTIHDHAFSGAFQVLAGQSIETNFSFQPSRDVGDSVRIGELDVRGSELRQPGDAQAVPAGPTYIHSLFHLARPSVTLVVRTYKDARRGRQLAYSPAGIAHDALTDDSGRDRIVQTVEMLRKTDHRNFEEWVGDLVASSDLHTAFSIIRTCARAARADLVDRLVARIADVEASRRIRDWVTHRRRIELLISRRGLVSSPSLRFLLAVLLNARRREDALALTARFAPEAEPAARIAAWLRELSAITIRLQLGTSPFEPNVLGLPPFGPGCEEGLAAQLAGREHAPNPEVRAFIDRMRALPVLEPLFVSEAR